MESHQIVKGNDLLEEAAQLEKQMSASSCSSNSSSSSTSPYGTPESSSPHGMQTVHSLALSLKEHLSSFSEQLEDTRETLEDTAACYYYINKCYEWALKTMKFVSSIRLADSTDVVALTKVINNMQSFIAENQPLTEGVFDEMMDIAWKLGDDQLIRQCKIAKARCAETVQLIYLRRSIFIKMRQMLEETAYCDREELLVSIWQPNCDKWGTVSSSAIFRPFQGSQPFSRRRSLGTVFPYSLCSPVRSYTAFPSDYYPGSPHRERYQLDLYIEEKEAQLSKQGFITEDLTDRGPITSVARRNSDSNCVPLQLMFKNCVVDECDPLRKSCSSKQPSSLGGSEDGKVIRNTVSWKNADEELELLIEEVKKQNEELKGNSIISKAKSDVCNRNPEDELVGDSPFPGKGAYSRNSSDSGISLTSPETLSSAKCESLPEEGIKHTRTQLMVMKEMIETEKDYVKSLNYIIENYVPELQKDNVPQHLRGQRNGIFGNIEKICEFHSHYFLQELKECENSPFLVGQCFLRYEPQFYLYALYNKNKPRSDTLLEECGNFFKKKQQELGDKMDLSSYLLKPVQRMGKYALLLKQLLKECPEKYLEFQDIKAAEEMVCFQLRHGNDLLAMDALRDCDVNVKEQGRLLRQEEFLVFQGKAKKCMRHVFLFEDLILFSKAKRDPDNKGQEIYQYKTSFKTTDIGLTEQVGDSLNKFEIWFRKRKQNDTFILQAPNPEVKQAWALEVSKLLWKQALWNRELRLAEMTSMGIGNKPSMYIKPNEDQISHRFVNVNKLRQGSLPRSTSNATPSLEYSSNKRPHSTISLSSSSSSSSFCSHHCPPSNSHLNRKSNIHESQSSMESGFFTDSSVCTERREKPPRKKVERKDSVLSNTSLTTHMSSTENLHIAIEELLENEEWEKEEEEIQVVPSGCE